jgi:ribosomal protein S18 acetylase RimI-like enzyme
VSRAAELPPPRAATAAPPGDLLELLQGVRRELRQRGEDFRGEWVERAAHDLHAGRQPGWYYPPVGRSGGIAFGSIRERRAWGHVHSEDEGGSRRLARALRDGLAQEAATVSIGFTGLPADSERRVLSDLAATPGGQVIERQAMSRVLGPEDANGPVDPPEALVRYPVRDVTLEALTDLDWRAFQGSVDDALVGGAPAEYRRVLSGLLENGLGPFLDAASATLAETEPLRLVGAILTAEVSAREAVFLDLMVDPERRRRGYARFLLRWALRALVGLGYASVRLWVTSSNTPALRLYQAEGFRRIASSTIYRWEEAVAGPQPHEAR